MEIKRLIESSITMEFMSMIVYQDLANKVYDEKSLEVLRYLARGEESHIATLVEIFSRYDREAMESPWEVDIIKAHRKEALSRLEKALEKWGISADSSAESILDFAQDAERYAHNYYSDLARKSSDEKLAGIFKTIAKEEKDHEVNIIRLKEMIKAG